MTPRIEQYKQAAQRATEWLLAQQDAEGSFLRPDLQADIYHKAAFALGITGHAREAMRLLNWIRAEALGADGRPKHFDAGLALYKSSWICQGAHRLARFDISRPVMGYIARCQAPCGGFFQVVEGNDYIEPVSTSWAGMSAIYLGELEVARRAASCLISMTDQQPQEDRFYFWMTPQGTLVTPDAPLGDSAPFVDAKRPQQPYYCTGIIMLFLARLYLATGDDTYLTNAWRIFDFNDRCADDAYAYPPSGKSAVGAAILYLISGDDAARGAAVEFADYLLQEQSPEGWWRNPQADNMIIRLDHTAEFIVWLSEIVAAVGASV